METVLIATAPVIAYKLSGGVFTIENFITFLTLTAVFTIIAIHYRCKYATPADKDGKQPDYDLSKIYIALIPIILWSIALLSLPYLAKYGAPIPVISIMLVVTSIFGLFMVGVFFYTSSIRFGVIPQCYPSILDGFFSLLKKLWPF